MDGDGRGKRDVWESGEEGKRRDLQLDAPTGQEVEKKDIR